MWGANQFRLSAALAAGLLLTGVAGKAASGREQAARHYKAANQLFEDLKQVPALELRAEQYELVARALRKVRLADASSGYSDDALLKLAQVYELAAERFQQDGYRAKAAATYELLTGEYPHSKHRATALQQAARLGSTPSPASPSPATETQVPVGALSDAVHEPGELVSPSPLPQASQPATLSRIRFHSYPDGTRLVLHVDRKTPLKYNWLERPARLYIDIFGSKLSEDLIKGVTADVQDNLLARARLAQNRKNKARLVIDLRGSISFDSFWLHSPGRLVIDLRRKGAARPQRTLEGLGPDPPPPAISESSSPLAAEATGSGRLSLTRALGLKLDRILIDAGHGGHDTGTIGRGGLQEKDVVLDVAQKLGELIRQHLGAEVIMTRDSDRFVELEERTKIANQRGADLMLSIHCNAAPTRSVRGVETYYLNFTADEWELSVASMENAASKQTVNQLSDLVSKIALDEKIEESRDFAQKIQTHLHAGLAKHSSSIRDRGIRKAPFVVLIGAEMPAVLVELGFISNRTDEALLADPSFRAEVAQHLLDGIEAYARSLGMVTRQSRGQPKIAQRSN